MYSPDAPGLAAKLGQAMATPQWKQAAQARENHGETAEDTAAKSHPPVWPPPRPWPAADRQRMGVASPTTPPGWHHDGYPEYADPEESLRKRPRRGVWDHPYYPPQNIL